VLPLPAAFLLLIAAAPTAAPVTSPTSDEAKATALPSLPLDALVASGPHGLEASPQARALDGRRVRLVGHMAHLEEAPAGAFYLAPRPVECDEGGGGTADLPPDAVRVVVRSAGEAPVRWLPGLIEVTGRLQVGPAADAEGRVASFQLVLDRAADLAASPAPPAAP